jgi:peptidyl-tRNA hydrolase, PTH1 family
VIACLGNPGTRYSLTWHNAGFWVADILAREAGVRFANAGLFLAADLRSGVHLIKPNDFMNRSGAAVAHYLDATGFAAADLLVVCDDVNLDLGRLRLRSGGSAGGHNGLADIVQRLGTEDFARLRLGVGPSPGGGDLADYVLSRVPARMEEDASLMAHTAADCVTMACESGVLAAQERYNRKPGE